MASIAVFAQESKFLNLCLQKGKIKCLGKKLKLTPCDKTKGLEQKSIPK